MKRNNAIEYLELEVPIQITTNHGGRPVIVVKKVIQDPEKIRFFFNKLINQRTEFYARLNFRDRFLATAKAKELGLF